MNITQRVLWADSDSGAMIKVFDEEHSKGDWFCAEVSATRQSHGQSGFRVGISMAGYSEVDMTTAALLHALYGAALAIAFEAQGDPGVWIANAVADHAVEAEMRRRERSLEENPADD